MTILEKINKYLCEGELTAAWKADHKKDKKEPSEVVCLECGKRFKKRITGFEVKCPKCGSYDTEIA
jgi:Zn finger protein HypA/HybF involved in hydrogenase expression